MSCQKSAPKFRELVSTLYLILLKESLQEDFLYFVINT